MEEEILESIDKKLDAIIRLLAGNFVQGKSKTDAIIALGAMGMNADIIAEIVGTTIKTVNTRLWEQKRKGKEGAKKAKKTQS